VLDRPRTRVIVWLVAYVAAASAAVALPREGGLVPWYPPLAAGVGILVAGGLRWWPLVLGLELLAAVGAVGLQPADMAVLAAPTVVEAVVAAAILRRLALRFERGGDALVLAAVAAAVATVGASVALALNVTTGGMGPDAAGLWSRWWLADVTTLTTLLPLVLLVVNRAQGTLVIPRHRHARAEVAAIFTAAFATVLGSAMAFAADPVEKGVFRTLWVIPILWMAVRYERLLAALVAAVMTLVSFFAFTAVGVQLVGVQLVGLQVSLVTTSILGLVVSGTLAGRRLAADGLERALVALDESERRYTHVFADSPAIQFLVDPETAMIIDASEAAARFYGYSREQLRTMKISTIRVAPHEVITRDLEHSRAEPITLFVDHRLASGDIRRMELRSGPVVIDGRKVLHSILRDATDELAARAEVARLAAAVESSAEAVVTTDLDGGITGWNGAAEQLYGYPRGAVMGRAVDDVLGPLDTPPEALSEMAREGRSIRFGHSIRRSADGVQLPVDLTISPIIAAGEVIGMSRISHDLREIMREEQRLRRSEALLADAAEIGGMGSWEVDPETGTATWSDQLYKITGLAPGTPVDDGTLRGLAHPDDAAGVELAFASQATGTPVAFRLLGADGRERSVVALWRLVAGSRGEGGRSVGVLRDVTEELAREEQLRQAQRLESIGMLAGGVAHDFNNLLTAIAGFADLASMSVEDGESPDADLRQVQAAVERGRALTTQLLTFSRRNPARPRPVDVGIAVKSLVPMLRRLLGEDIAILTDLEADIVAVVDPGQLDQVIVNLSINARDAMPDGGRLRIAAGPVSPVEPGPARPSRVWIEVEDDGNGIAPDLLDRIFLPFFTTKEHGQGTGLGLATVQGIVTDAGGRVDVASRPGDGTVFRVELPGFAGGGARDEEVHRAARATGDGLVLLVEDEDLVRQVAKRILERAGFRVLAAANAPDGLAIAARERPDILVSDIVLPGMGDGISLAEELHERWPDLPVLLMTGYTERVPPSWVTLLTKPYEVDDLVGNVRRLLDEVPAGAGAEAVPGG